MKFITTKEADEKWISDQRVQILRKQGRIKGAYRLGWTWAIPEDAFIETMGLIEKVR